MSKQASPTVIGSFVVGAVALVVVGVLIFGSGKFFSDTISAVMYFQGDLTGLQEGAEVAYEGVNIGTVTDIEVFIDSETYAARTPVVVQIQRDHFRLFGERKELPGKGEALKVMIEQKGLRAQLQSGNMVTGQRVIQLAFYPDVPPAQLTIDPLTKLPEIPTVPTTLQQVQDVLRKALVKIGELPLEEIVHNLNQTLEGIDHVVNAPEIMDSVRTIKATLVDVQQVVREMNKQVEVAVAHFGTTMDNVNNLTKDLGKLTQNVDGRVPEVMTSFTEAAKSAQQTLASVNGTIEPNSAVRYEMVKALRDLSEAARALRSLADYLDRYPNSVIFGRTGAGAQ
ncbi:MAG TPA: MlaD family protein [Candidatus Binatia bacterium]|nr:MlaD family protein [Candidatus Binatia bacterium]